MRLHEMSMSGRCHSCGETSNECRVIEQRESAEANARRATEWATRALALAAENAELRAAIREVLTTIGRSPEIDFVMFRPGQKDSETFKRQALLSEVLTAILASPAGERGRLLLEAGNALAEVAERESSVPETWGLMEPVNRWRALVGGQGEG